MKIERYNLIYIMDFDKGSLMLVDPDKLVFCQTSLSEYAEKTNHMMTTRLLQAEQKNPDGTTDTVFARFKRNEDLGNYLPPMFADSVSWRKTADTLRVTNYTATKYVFQKNKMKLEEVWLAPALKLKDQINWLKLYEFLTVVENQGFMVSYMLTPEYFELLKIGYPVRKIIYTNFVKTEFQINLIEEKKVPAYEFYSPDLCKELSVDKWIELQNRGDFLEDDYE